MDAEQMNEAWDALDWNAWERDRIEEVRDLYEGWLRSDRLVRTPDPSTPGDLSGHLVEDFETTLLDRLLMYETLGEWAAAEYTGASEATHISGVGLRYPTHGEVIAEQVEEDAVRVLMENVPSEVEDNEEPLYAALELVHEYAPLDAWESGPCADAVERDVWIEALADHIRNGRPGAEYVDALTMVYPGITAFQLPVAISGEDDPQGGATTLWLVACDWLDKQEDGGRVANAIRAAIREV